MPSGRLIAAILAGAWRSPPPALDLSDSELNQITPLLLRSGEAAIGWRRVRRNSLRSSPAAAELRQAYRFYSIWAALHERHVRCAIVALRSAGVDPLLWKGWAVARLYPERGLRPYEDIDLCVWPEQYGLAESALVVPDGTPKHPVDLHRGFSELEDGGLDEVYRRSEFVTLEALDVRIPGPEDHLRYLCLHFLKHGGNRPIWLCDIAVFLESRPEYFDWAYCLRGDRRRSEWIVYTLVLAHRLLGARLDRSPAEAAIDKMPDWLPCAVIGQWDAGFQHDKSRRMIEAFGRRSWLIEAVRERWPNPILASYDLQVPFNAFPRLPFQVVWFINLVLRFAARTALSQVPRRGHAVFGGKLAR